MVPDIFQYFLTFWMNFGTSNLFTKSGPSDPLFITGTLQKIQVQRPIHLWKILFSYLNILEIQKIVHSGKGGGRKVPNNRLMEILKILDMRPISSKKHEWYFANIVPISITKHKMAFGNFELFGNFGINILESPGRTTK